MKTAIQIEARQLSLNNEIGLWKSNMRAWQSLQNNYGQDWSETIKWAQGQIAEAQAELTRLALDLEALEWSGIVGAQDAAYEEGVQANYKARGLSNSY